MIRILLVDDHTIVREALHALLAQDPEFEIVGQAHSGSAALQLAAELTPDLVLMDIFMPGMDGIEATRRLHEQRPQTRVLALSTACRASAIKQIFKAGASGFVVKSAAGTELRHGIRKVARGENYLCRQSAQALADELSQTERTPGELIAHQLSRRELEVAMALAYGGSASVVAEQLHISTTTVEVHRRNILRKLGLHKTVDLTRVILQARLLHGQESR